MSTLKYLPHGNAVLEYLSGKYRYHVGRVALYFCRYMYFIPVYSDLVFVVVLDTLYS